MASRSKKNSGRFRKCVPSILLLLLFASSSGRAGWSGTTCSILLNFSYPHRLLSRIGDGAVRRRGNRPAFCAAGGGGLHAAVSRRDLPREYADPRVFWYYLFLGVIVEAATIHYAAAIVNLRSLLFRRGWCGYACWTAMVRAFYLAGSCRKPRESWAFCAM